MTLSKFILHLLTIGPQYYIFAGSVFLVFYVLLKRRVNWRKIQPKFPAAKDYRREIFFSSISIVIFTLPPFILLENQSLRIHTTFYKDISEHGRVYFWAAFPLMLVMHDTYFYWMHRLIHHPKLFRLFHLVHHRSVNPTPWAAYSFHPLEAVTETFIYIIFLFTIPVTLWHLFFFFLVSLSINVYGHLGYELLPPAFSRRPIGRWINTSVGHNLHHHHFKGNYGLYFLFWDRVMGTIRPDYDEAFLQATTKPKKDSPKGTGLPAKMRGRAA